MKPKIVFTGGGTAGHVTPNLALIDYYNNQGWEIFYIGSENGVEKNIIADIDVKYYAIPCGKLRRYLSLRNFIDPIKIIGGVFQAYFLLGRLNSEIVFSKGGFVAFPVVVAAWLRRIPVIAHESDFSPGLANKMCFPFVKTLCVNFNAVSSHFTNANKVIVTGTPIRQNLLSGDKNKGLKLCRFNETKPRLLIIGGSLGSENINLCIRKSLDKLLKKFQIIHICGTGKVDDAFKNIEGYCQLEYLGSELGDIFSASDIVISRSGANSVFEILALKKAHIFIPLSKKYSRGDQIQNARYFKNKGISFVIEEDELSPDRLLSTLDTLWQQKDSIEEKIKNLNVKSGTENILTIIDKAVNAKRRRQKKF